MVTVRDAGRWVVRAALLSAVLLLALPMTPASAHSELVRSDPPEGGLVAVGHTALRLWYAEDVDLSASSFELHTNEGSPVEVSVADSGGGAQVELESAPLELGIYVLDWRVTSLEDGHTTAGSVLFGAGIRPDTVTASGAGLPDAGTVGWRWLDLAALLLAIGGVAVSALDLGRVRRRAVGIGLAAVVVAVASGALAPFQRAPREDTPWQSWVGTTLGSMTSTPWGRAWLVREAVLVVALVALVLLLRRVTSARIAWWVSAVALAAAAVADSWVGHASTLPRAAVPTAVIAAVHVVAAGVWAGGLTAMALCLLLRRRGIPPTIATVWRAFSPMAAIATVVLLATGLYETGRQIPDLGALTGTVYGRVIAGKAVAMALALGLAGINTLLVNRRLATLVARRLRRAGEWLPVRRERFARVVAGELAVLALAVVGAALLTSVPTARESQEAARVSAPKTAAVQGLFVTFEELPAGPGRSRVVVRVSPTVRPQPGPLLGVDVLLVDPDDQSTPVTLRKEGAGRYEAQIEAPRPGEWQAWLAVRRDQVPDAVTTMTWVVTDPRSDPVTRLEAASTAGAVLLVAGLAVTLVWVRRRRRPGEEADMEIAEPAQDRSDDRPVENARQS